MKRNLNVSAWGQSSLMMALMVLGASLKGCGPGETASPRPGATSTPPTTSATTAGPAQKPGRPNVDTTSRRELQKKRAEERAKSK
jgi:hypothetical protein